MSVKDRIIEFFENNPDQKFTSKEVSQKLGIKLRTCWNEISDLQKRGILSSEHNQKEPRNPLYELFHSPFHSPKTAKMSFHSPLHSPLHSFHSPLHSPLHSPISRTLILTMYSILLFPIPISYGLEESVQLNAITKQLEKILNPSGKALLDTLPESALEKIEAFFRSEVFPLLRRPDISAGPTPVKTAPKAPVKLPIPSEEALRKIFPKGIPKRNLAAEAEYKKSRSKETVQKESCISANIFAPHIRYFGLTPDQRNFEFGRAWAKIMGLLFKAYRISPSYQSALRNLPTFQSASKFRCMMRDARIEADLLNARYEDYMVGICQYYFDRNAHSSRDATPQPKDLAGEAHVAAAKDHLDQSSKGRILITKADIEYGGNADFLLGENFTKPTTPTEQEQRLTYYQDHLFPEVERAAYLGGHPLADLTSFTITYGLLPKEWAEGYGTFHHLKKLKGYKFTTPPKGFDLRNIFQTTQE
jgi:hypothetical protein